MDDVDRVAAETRFSGVVRVDRDGEVAFARAYGLAHRGWEVPNQVGTRFGVASGTKLLTALAVLALVEDGALDLGTTARSLLGDDLPLIPHDVTVGHLLTHRSGIGDYLDEDDEGYDVAAHVLAVPVHRLATTEDYLAVIDGFHVQFTAGTDFAYNNGGYVVLALLAERASRAPFHDLVDERVCGPAAMADTAFLRMDELPGGVATGYLHAEGHRSNVLHLPVRGSGDGGAFTTAADVAALWEALYAGRIVGPETVALMTTRHTDRYGMGLWLHPSSAVVSIEGGDAGVSFRSVHDPERRVTHTVLSNTTEGAWAMTRLLDELLAT